MNSRDATLLLVLGMHRSGTSALTGLLARLGVELGEALLPATDANAAGYFENERVVAAHQGMLFALGRDWHDPRPLPAGWTASGEAVQAAGRLVGAVEPLLAQAPVVAVKDPRASRVVPLWLEVAAQIKAQAKALLTLRHPDEVAASLARRDGMSAARAYLLWLSHLLDAERDTRGIPRAFVSYDELLVDWRTVIARIDAALGTRLVAASAGAAGGIDRFLDVGLRHHSSRTDVVDEPFRALALEAYARASECVTDPAGCRDEVFDELARACAAQGATYVAAVEDAVAFEVPMELRAERQRLALDRARVDAALQLAALRELWRPAQLEHRGHACKLYFRADGTDFIEARSVVVHAAEAADGVVDVDFEIPADEPVDHVRIDPDDSPGVFSLLSLRIDGAPLPELERRLGPVNELLLQPPSGGAFRFAALGHDPFFVVDLRSPAGRTVRRIGLSFRRETVASQLGGRIDDYAARTCAAYAAVLEAQHAGTAALAAHAKTLDAGIVDLRTQALAAMEAHAITVLQALDGVRAESGASKQLLQDNVLQSMETHALTLLGALDLSRTTAAEANSRLATGLAAVAEKLELLDARIAAIDEAQSCLRTWARRRSISYWWHRLLGRST